MILVDTSENGGKRFSIQGNNASAMQLHGYSADNLFRLPKPLLYDNLALVDVVLNTME